MTNKTLRTLGAGGAIGDSDLFLTRQGSDIVDKSVTGNQIKDYVSSNFISLTFETVSKNLKAYPASMNYSDGLLTSIVYTVPDGTIIKTFGYTGGQLTSIVLSGDTPSGIDLTKTLTYTGGALTGVNYT